MICRYHNLKGVHEYLDIIFEKHKKDWDTVIAICGPVGAGKSNLGLHMLEYWNTKLYGECKESDIKHMCLNTEMFLKDLSTCKKREMIVYDEAGELSSRNAMSVLNKDLMITYQIIRADNIFTILVLPDIWYIDSYFRNTRIKGLFYVPHRGRVAFWGGTNLKKMLERNQYKMIKNYFVTQPNFTDKYPIYKGIMAEGYKVMKENKTTEARKNVVNRDKKKENEIKIYRTKCILRSSEIGLPRKDTSYVLGISERTISRDLKLANIGNGH